MLYCFGGFIGCSLYSKNTKAPTARAAAIPTSQIEVSLDFVVKLLVEKQVESIE